MNLGAIYHRMSEQYCYSLDEDRLIINIKTGYDVDKIYIVYGDPYEAGIMGGAEKWSGDREEIYFKKRLKDHIWWTTTLMPKYKRCKYYFEIHSKDECMYYFEDGFYTEDEMNQDGKTLSYFIMPWMNPADVCTTPSWVNDTVWYQIFPERFCNGDPSIDPENVKPWQSGKVGMHDFYGGDIKGIRDKIPYLKDLGITGIYLNPVFESTTNHKYNTRNYKLVDPHFGTNEELRTLVDEAHAAGIRVMLDAVFNHTGYDHPMWLDVLEKGQESKYAQWYMVNKWPIERGRDTKDGRYYSFAFAEYMPKLNTNNPEVQDYLLDIIKFWIDTFDIDGLRFDVGNEVSHSFLKAIRYMTKRVKSDFYLLGEIWHDSISWLLGDEYDSVMNYPLTTAIADFWVYKNRDRQSFEYDINRCFTMYYSQVNDVLFNLLDSHDTNRLFDKCHKNIDIFYQQLAVLFTMPGSPCIYYGTEVALDGGYDPDCRRCMPWSDIDAGKLDDKLSEMKSLISMRKTIQACKSRNFHFPNDIAKDRVISYLKIGDNESLQVYLNCENEDVSIPLPENYDVVFARKWKQNDSTCGTLTENGVLIIKI
ncbi:glycoside hydrolase family 13 protein [Butyrivibrio sp.]|uniref:glycoside hydrolase family 13 protein n=1 Tax=Butyrivibrio sp. TaxID=28121 RepID=UPI0025C25023|nr:glycoside hydrolase family 13 protein [Butyrivibrio sp.]MBQ7430635.1 alpha-glycosidase [Butyrivibrio sp.]MBQ9302878.1 alpha-glycosidase [Butyrivibrio sp.]